MGEAAFGRSSCIQNFQKAISFILVYVVNAAAQHIADVGLEGVGYNGRMQARQVVQKQ
jgi:hypothetical protein